MLPTQDQFNDVQLTCTGYRHLPRMHEADLQPLEAPTIHQDRGD